MPEQAPQPQQGRFVTDGDGAFVPEVPPTPEDIETALVHQSIDIARAADRGPGYDPNKPDHGREAPSVYQDLGGQPAEPAIEPRVAETRETVDYLKGDRTHDLGRVDEARRVLAASRPPEEVAAPPREIDDSVFRQEVQPERAIPNRPTPPKASPYRPPREIYPNYKEPEKSA